jgi:hypothetical protein
MPFVSRAQQRWGHTPAGEKALGGKSAVAEWDHATPKGASVPQYSKGEGSKEASYASGGAVLGRSRDFTKTPDTKFGAGGKRQDFKKAGDTDSVDPQNTRTADEGGGNRLGSFLGGGDRFTSQNFAEQGDPASMQRTKPDENWSKEHVKESKGQKALRFGDGKSEKPIKPRK